MNCNRICFYVFVVFFLIACTAPFDNVLVEHWRIENNSQKMLVKNSEEALLKIWPRQNEKHRLVLSTMDYSRVKEYENDSLAGKLREEKSNLLNVTTRLARCIDSAEKCLKRNDAFLESIPKQIDEKKVAHQINNSWTVLFSQLQSYNRLITFNFLLVEKHQACLNQLYLKLGRKYMYRVK